MRNQTIVVDINKEICRILRYKQYDNNNLLQIIVEKDNERVSLNGYIGYAFFKLPSGLVIKKDCSIQGSEVTINIDNNVLSESGKIALDLTLSDGNKTFTLFRINLVIEESIDKDDAIIVEAGWDIVSEIAKINEKIENLDGVDEGALDELSSKINDVTSQLATNVKQIESVELIIDDFLYLVEDNDYTLAFKEMFNFAKANENIKKIFIKNGVYEVSVNSGENDYSIFKIDFPVEIHLGSECSIKLKTNDKQRSYLFDICDTHNVMIHGGKLIGDRYTHIDYGNDALLNQWHYGIRISNSKNVNIQNIETREFCGDGICVMNNSEKINIINIKSTENRRQAITLGCVYDVLIDSCTLTETPDDILGCGIDIEPDPGDGVPKKITIRNNYISNNNIGINFAGDYAVDVKIYGNVIQETIDSCIAIHNQSKNIFISNNTFECSTIVGRGILLRDETLNLNINNNVFKGFSASENKSAIMLNSDTINTSINNNVFYECHTAIYCGVEVNGILIDSNIFKNINQRCIFPLVKLKNSKISNNSIKDVYQGIYMRFENVEIINNDFENITQSALVGNPLNCIINGNKIINASTEKSDDNPSINFEGTDLGGNLIINNYIRNNAIHIAIYTSSNQIVNSIVTNNDCRFTDCHLNIDSNDVNSNNWIL